MGNCIVCTIRHAKTGRLDQFLCQCMRIISVLIFNNQSQLTWCATILDRTSSVDNLRKLLIRNITLLIFLLDLTDLLLNQFTTSLHRTAGEHNHMHVIFLAVTIYTDQCIHIIRRSYIDGESLLIETMLQFRLVGNLQRCWCIRINLDLRIRMIHQLQRCLEYIDCIKCCKRSCCTGTNTKVPLHQNIRESSCQIHRFNVSLRICFLYVIYRGNAVFLTEETIHCIFRQTCRSITRSCRFHRYCITITATGFDIRNHRLEITTQSIYRLCRRCFTMRIHGLNHSAGNGCHTNHRLIGCPASTEHRVQYASFNKL